MATVVWSFLWVFWFVCVVPPDVHLLMMSLFLAVQQEIH